MVDQQQTLLPLERGTDRESFLLRSLEVYNWGPFAGLHRAEFDTRGTAIIGPTGSGKTTLVDALMTLLVSQPRYNLASTGGHESDRTLISYVRGVLGGDGSDGREEVARPAKTITGICATYTAGEETLRLAGLLWTDGTSNAAADLKRRWLFSLADDQSLESWMRLLHEEGIRDLMRMGRETAKLRIFESKKSYLAHTRKFFDVGENAFTLLNRAAGLKQLNSIDEIFRDLVLDDRTAFDRALEVAAEFENLAAIHAELETARRQQQSLVPVQETHEKLLKQRAKTGQTQTLKRIVEVWFAIAGESRWTQTLEKLADERDAIESQLRKDGEEQVACQVRADTLKERYLELGGNVIGELENTIDALKGRVAERQKHANDYRQMVKAFGLTDDISQTSLTKNQATVAARRSELQQQRETQEEKTLACLSKLRDEQGRAKELESALRSVQDRPGSNIPPRFQDFRAELGIHLSVVETELPFLAELVEVKSEESNWRGAIERAIGAERLRVLVPEKLLPQALAWVNGRDNRLHVRLQKAAASDAPGKFFEDGYTRKLNFKKHALRETAKRMLAARDLHCVESAQALERTEHGLTIEGMISGRKGRFEKQDRTRLQDNWMTGFDNKDQLHALAGELKLANAEVERREVESGDLRRKLTACDNQLAMVDRFLQLEFASIDLPGAESELQRSVDRLTSLLDPNSDASQAKAAYDAESKNLSAIHDRITEQQKRLGVLEEKSSQASDRRERAAARIGDGLSDEELALAEKKLPIKAELAASLLDDAEREMTAKIDEKLSTQLDHVADTEKRLVRLMESALRVDTGALAETSSNLTDVNDYLERLQVLNKEALPEKQNRFLEYLNRSSDQGVTQLLSRIGEEVDAVEHRIRDLNVTLAKVDFRAGRYLQLQPQRIKHERLRSLETAMRKLRSAALKDDFGESHYQALREVIEILREAGENRRQLGSRALLDPRYRLQFFVVEVDRKTGDRSPPRTGSQSGSGGEKELMASHILTASLSYALCPTEATCPLYGTVVLDEAFSKSSPSAAGRIIEALRIFRLHPIFVTPNKEIGLLKRHTRKVICVQRPGKQASLASISWEKLDELAKPLSPSRPR